MAKYAIKIEGSIKAKTLEEAEMIAVNMNESIKALGFKESIKAEAAECGPWVIEFDGECKFLCGRGFASLEYAKLYDIKADAEGRAEEIRSVDLDVNVLHIDDAHD